MKTVYVAALGAAVIAGCTSQVTAESPTPGQTSKAYDVPAFTGLDVATGIEVEFTTGGEQSVVAENKNGAWDKLEVSVKNGELHLRRVQQNWGLNLGGKKKEKFKVTVSAPRLDSVETSSGSSVKGSGVSGDNVQISTTSGSTVRISDVSAGTLDLDTSSGSTAVISGTCSDVSADTSSGSSLRAKDLVCATGDLDSSSGSSLSISITENLNADASSGSSINVSGDPAIKTVDKSSGASVNIRG